MQACGYAESDAGAGYRFAPAPNFKRIFIRADAITGIAQRLDRKGIPCVSIQTDAGVHRLVIGNDAEILAKVKAALPYCYRYP